MPFVKLRDDWNGTFRRSIRDQDGQILRTLVFNPGEPIDLNDEEIAAVKNDLGKALLPIVYSKEKRKYEVVDLNEIDVDASVEAAKSQDSVARTGESDVAVSSGGPPSSVDGPTQTVTPQAVTSQTVESQTPSTSTENGTVGGGGGSGQSEGSQAPADQSSGEPTGGDQPTGEQPTGKGGRGKKS